jgi:hypothetical protein
MIIPNGHGGRSSLGKRCQFCGRFFIPDYRVGERQKACRRVECRQARKRLAQESWCAKNPGYFQGRYPYVKEWRQRKKAADRLTGAEMIQDEIPPSKPLLRLILLIPGEKEGMIQDKIVLQRQSRRTFAAYG